MKVNPFSDTLDFLIGNTNDHIGSGVRWLLVLLFWALFLAGLWIARSCWKADPNQRTREHLAIWFMRMMIGCMWFQGSLWKLPLPVSGGFKYWTEQLGEHAAFDVHKWVVKHVFLPNLWLVNPLVYLTELSLAVAFILGLFVRPMAALGILFTVQLWFGLYRHPGEWPWQYVFLMFTQGFFLLHAAGQSLGLDGWIKRAPFGPFKGDGFIARLYRRFA